MTTFLLQERNIEASVLQEATDGLPGDSHTGKVGKTRAFFGPRKLVKDMILL